MAKNIKINIKNAQLAEALKNVGTKKTTAKKEPAKKKPGSTKKAAPKKTAAKKTEPKETQAEETVKKPKARILPPEKKAAPKKEPVEEKAEVKKKPKAKIVKETETTSPSAKEEEKKVEESVEKPVEASKDETAEKAPVEEKKPKRRIDLDKLYPKKAAQKKKIALPPTQEKPKEETTTARKEKKPGETQDDKQPKKHISLKPTKKVEGKTTFDSRYRMGLRSDEERDSVWRKRRPSHKKRRTPVAEEDIIRPKNLKIRLPITVKDLASEMKLKASQIISKLFLQGMVLTLNDILDDETTVQLVGHEFDCEISIDTAEEKRLQITSKTIEDEISETATTELTSRPPVITFMGHVDHGKTSLIDAIRKSNITAQEAGAITQHIGAFTAKTSSGKITILDTPGHEAFDEMRERGAHATDIVILVIAGDEGMRDQTVEALNHAKAAKVPIIVAINKSDKGGFDQEKVYRQLADHELLPEAWGGSTITVNCSAINQEGITDLLEMISLQAEVLELKANPKSRARGTILESQMHKGLGAVATILVQNGTLRIGDPIVFGSNWGRIKTLHDQFNKSVPEAGPSTPVKVTGLSDLADAGCEFIVIPSEKEARILAHDRKEVEKKQLLQRPKSASLDTLLSDKKETQDKLFLPLILRCDVQGSLEALKTSLNKIPSKKVGINFVSAEVGEISESDIELAAASKATIIGFHTRIESHADPLIRQLKTDIRLHSIIYHAIDDVKELMQKLLPKIPEEKDTGTAEVIAIFKSSQLGLIAGCKVSKGSIRRDHRMRVIRNDETIWDGKISSIKRVKEDVKEVQKGVECGILLEGFSSAEVGDIFQAYEIVYHEQTL